MRLIREEKTFIREAVLLMLPMILQNFVTFSMSMADTFMVGVLGETALAAVTMANSPFYVMQLMIFGVQSGMSVLVAQYHGRGDQEAINRVMGIALFVSTTITGLLAITAFCIPEQIMRVLTNNADLVAPGAAYTRYVGFSYFFSAISGVYIAAQRSTENPRLGAVLLTVSGALNIFLNWVLIYGKLGFPMLGVRGAAIATVLSRYVEFGLILLGTHGKKTPPRFIRGLYRGFAIPGHLAGQIVRKGMPLLVNEMFWSLGMTMLTQCYSYRGLDAIAALNINSTVLNLFNTVIFTMGNTVGIIIGNLLGAEEYDRARNYCPKLAALSCAASAAVGVVMFLVAPYAPRLYNTSHEIMTLAASLMRICALMLPVHAVVNAAYWTIRAGGRTYITMLSDSVFTWVVSVPIAWVLIHKTGLPLVEAYLFVNLADLIKMVIGIVLLRRGIWVRNIVTGEEIAAGNAAG